MPKKTNPKEFLDKPVLIGGEKAFKKLVKENLIYPESALANKVEGTVKVKYSVGGNGKILRPKVEKGLGHGCDEEAIRLVKMMKYSRVNNIKVNITIQQEVQIHFKLPKVETKPKPSGMKVSYKIVKTSKVPKEAPKKQKSYGYTIKWNA